MAEVLSTQSTAPSVSSIIPLLELAERIGIGSKKVIQSLVSLRMMVSAAPMYSDYAVE